MKSPVFGIVTILILIPVLYLGGYAVLYANAGSQADAAAFGGGRPSIRVNANQVSILTRDHPAAEAAVKAFEPFMLLHARITGTTFYIAAQEFN